MNPAVAKLMVNAVGESLLGVPLADRSTLLAEMERVARAGNDGSRQAAGLLAQTLLFRCAVNAGGHHVDPSLTMAERGDRAIEALSILGSPDFADLRETFAVGLTELRAEAERWRAGECD